MLAQRRRARALAEEAERAVGFGGGLGGFLGTAAAIFSDPVQVLALPLGAGRLAGGVLRQALKAAAIEGGVAAGVQAAVEAEAGRYREAIGAPGDSLERIAAAAAGGAIIGGGLRALLAGVERALARSAVAPGEALEAQAAMAAARAEEMLAAANPTGPEGAAAHDRAVAQAVAAVARGETPRTELPPAAAPETPAQRLAALSPDELRAHVRAAIDEVMATQGRRADAAWRQDLGAITIEWGVPGDPTRNFRGGYGLAHILAKRQADGLDGEAFLRETLPALLVSGRAENLRGPPDGQRIDLVLGRDRAVLSLFRDGSRETWLLTAYRQDGGPGGTGGVNPAPPYAPPPSGVRETAGAGPPVSNLPPGPRRFKVYAPTGRAVVVEPRVVELDTLVVSHGPDGRPNPAYPHAEGLQPRERGAAPSQDQVRAIAANLIPDRLKPNVEAGLGAPIIGPDLAVEGGNGRVAALTLVYRDERFAAQRAAYRAMVEAIDPAAAAMREPVLVSARITPLTAAERAVWARELNMRTTAAASTVEEAKLDAERLRPLMGLWRAQEADAAANAELVRRFLDTLGPEERRGLLDDRGRLTALGRQRIDRAVLTLAYGDELGPLLERLLLSEGEGYKAVAGALRDVAPEWATLRDAVARGEVDAAMDTTAQLAEAVRWLDEARVRKLPVRQLLAQLDLDRPPPTELARAWLALWHTGPDMTGRLRARERIAEALRGYVDEARKHLTGPNLFGLAPSTAADVLATAARKADAQAVAEQLTVRTAPDADAGPATGQALRQAEAARARQAAAPETEAAELLEARRELAARDLDLAVDEAGTLRSARELLDEAEAAEAEAAAAATCLVGAAA